MIKFYMPDGHLEKKTIELFEKAGFEISINGRDYNPKIDDPNITLKRLRPQDFPFVLSIGKGDMAITGSDILEEYRLKNPKEAGNIRELLDLGLGKTRLCAAVSEDVLPKVKTIRDFAGYTKGREVVVATEYPNITEDYLKRNGIKAIIRKPAGKTEAWLTPPSPEAEMIIETTETGRTLKENRCTIIGEVLTATSRLVCNTGSLKDPGKKRKIEEIVMLFEGALKGKGKVNVYMNVLAPKDLDKILDTLKDYVRKPTINDLRDGGYEIFIIIDEKDLKYLLPQLKKKGASSIAVSNTRMLI
ncbi:MAG: ATP phosphoribosyltransferase [Candidatus Altiarchaeota archaeon]|nr:ATP phosphoribosyltransferase [Candidatus Altiarchaeota archaeon]